MSNDRLFVSTGLPASISSYLTQLQDVFRPKITAPDAMLWLQRNAMHLTIRFIGDMPSDQIRPISDALSTVQFNPIQLHLNGIGYFPNFSNPRVLWAGVAGQLAELHALRNQVDTVLKPFGGKVDPYGYTPHLTLGYIKAPALLAAMPEQMALEQLPLTIQQIELVRTRAHAPTEPPYETLHTVTAR